MKLLTLYALVVFGTCLPAFADTPSQMDLIRNLDSYYSGDLKYEGCVEQLNAGEPISVPVSYRNRLVAASFAEGLIASCE
jgi:hypothetical protein